MEPNCRLAFLRQNKYHILVENDYLWRISWLFPIFKTFVMFIRMDTWRRTEGNDIYNTFVMVTGQWVYVKCLIMHIRHSYAILREYLEFEKIDRRCWITFQASFPHDKQIKIGVASMSIHNSCRTHELNKHEFQSYDDNKDYLPTE